MANKSIYVTMPTLAPLEEVTQLMQGIWERGIMTHNGPLVQRFEKEVADYLHLRNIVSVTNGTIAIHMAIRALGIKGEIITTPLLSSLQSAPLFGRVVRLSLLILILIH